ncbi:MAG: SDR family oxidoreductase [Alphaproteobacteria bacterium]|nr:SDR family oxidoreductase [Alphaproteobacteria bacterium]
MTGLVEGKAAIVTGAASGIGAATAALLAEEGAGVLAVDLPGSPLASVHAGRERIVCLEMDVTAPEAGPAIVRAALDAFGRLDILFNNAGTVGKGGEVETHDEADWQFVIDLNMTSIYRLSKAAMPHLKKSEAARIVNVGSVRSDFAESGAAAYTATKHGVAGLTKVLACELGRHGTANYIQPGAILTGITRPAFERMPDYAKYWKERAPVGRFGEPEDIANAVLFLASEEAGYVSGIGLWVDGGAMCHG